jgi:hypothetical protein
MLCHLRLHHHLKVVKLAALHTAGAAPAHANYSHWSNHGSGFGQLRVTTHASYSNQVQMQAAGFVEGYLTAPDIFNHWYNQRWWLSQKTNDTYKVMNWCVLLVDTPLPGMRELADGSCHSLRCYTVTATIIVESDVDCC